MERTEFYCLIFTRGDNLETVEVRVSILVAKKPTWAGLHLSYAAHKKKST